nr:helicase 2 [Menippe mercenaria nudivirus]
MNPILLSMLSKDEFTSLDYDCISNKLGRSRSSLETLQVETVKELIYCKINDNAKLILKMADICNLPEKDCSEYNYLYNTDVSLPHYMVLHNTQKSKLALSLLNAGQRRVVLDILNVLSCSCDTRGNVQYPTVCLLEAPSGTGKSFLIDCLYLCLRNQNITIAARNKVLLSNICTIRQSDMNVVTTCKFIMDTFKYSYEETTALFDKIDTTDQLKCIYKSMNERCNFGNTTLIVVDEYSMESPIFLTIIVLLAAINKINIVFIGDSNQHNTLTPSALHNSSNYNLLNTFPVKSFNLDEQMRIKDVDLNCLVDTIKTYIHNRKTIEDSGDVKNTSLLKYEIYKQCKAVFSKHHINTTQCIYLTDCHKKIKKHILKTMDYAKQHNIAWKIEPYGMWKEGFDPIVMSLPSTHKYMSALVLIEGGLYLHPTKGIVTIVTLDVDEIEVRIHKTQEIVTIRKAIWSKKYHACVDGNYRWLMNHVEDGWKLLQYPLRPCSFTHHFVQGLTFPTENVIIDIDASSANSLYVSLSRIGKTDQLKFIYTDEFLGFLLTEYKNDGYIYSIPNPSLNLINHLKQYIGNRYYTFQDVTNYQTLSQSTFENKKYKINCRMLLGNTTNGLQSVGDTTTICKSRRSVLEQTAWRMYQKIL